jgi:hypothetical protein
MASVVWEEEVGGGKWQRAEEFIIVGDGQVGPFQQPGCKFSTRDSLQV